MQFFGKSPKNHLGFFPVVIEMCYLNTDLFPRNSIAKNTIRLVSMLNKFQICLMNCVI